MRSLLLASISLLISSAAFAQQVPALANATASAPVPGGQAAAHSRADYTGVSAIASAAAPAPAYSAGAATTAVPATMPPAINRLSPSAPLNAKEQASAQMARIWRNRDDRPSRGEDGVLRWTFGASLPSVVCAPLQVGDVALQPGEVVNNVHVGDLTRWSITPAVSGDGADRTTHLIIKPSDAGLVSSVLVFTDKRIYSIKLISTRLQWTPLTAFIYPETAAAAWANYGTTISTGSSNSRPVSAGGDDVDFDYVLTGRASWRPVRVYSDAGKTVIEFPDACATAPLRL